ncbi:hypothetical protein ROLI_040150 [Roseobacter fucihabitans]|uniref:Probable branched-chain-amino-acid aminotransferase n=1 Tax=Roseobacter fucihabitans TaxID=1537242 RepID=A0ABZ2BXV7_9RHOB|nr:aminotransferase class IV [Roseobacter litoralis]MBC6964882.1 putative branched-chain-amino-acid aminotransferase [Roseobacter litoralis]
MTSQAPLEVFETLRFERNTGHVRLELHLARLTRSRRFFNLRLCENHLRQVLKDAAPDHAVRVRISVTENQAIPKIAYFDLPGDKDLWRVAIHKDRVDETEIWRAHKTNRREVPDVARVSLPAGIDEWIFLNTKREVCEGTITNVFLRMSGQMFTPPLAAGALPGILRQSLITSGQAQERRICEPDLKASQNALLIGNSLRGLIPVTRVDM